MDKMHEIHTNIHGYTRNTDVTFSYALHTEYKYGYRFSYMPETSHTCLKLDVVGELR